MIVTRILVVAVLAASSVAYADLTKEQCVDAHSRGQDAKEQGHLSLARKLFLQCAQSSCPSIVQGDCARFADELNRLQPSVTLAARDGNGADLPDTTVYIDDVLVATRLDDGRPHDIDPGKHVFKFSNGGHDEVVTVVIGTGEQGRAVTATFGAATPKPVAGAADNGAVRAAVEPPAPHMVHPLAPKIVMYGGAALGVVGFAFASFELTRIPSQCSLGDHVCNATPGDPVYNSAHNAVELSNIGWIVGGVGAAAFVGGLVWYIKTGHMEGPAESEHVSVAPWFSGTGGGLAISGPLR
ncbi:MAG TPA: hypothetical protein VH143_34805 [Kofleriaceae bacterium]|jgi:hypothetical protein|nr:hypothetical protein [Kofleriaceae bacterium]